MARVAAMVAALWWGSLSTIGLLVVPLLFAHLPTRAIAGGMAARLFAAQTWVSLACGLALLVFSRTKSAEAVMPSSYLAIGLIAFSMLLALLAQFVVAPHIVARDNLRLWHSVGSVMYLLQWASAGAVLWLSVAHPVSAG
ncbi:MAG: Putative transmembrane protein [Burkholderiaceae bacterium]|jgi:hypothetical protein|nr:MAG: Putative transmembrane protein [Burkholderiaceae bacterium]